MTSRIFISPPGAWFIARWPDATWCDWEDRHTMSHMSDDYEQYEVVSFDEDNEPYELKRKEPT